MLAFHVHYVHFCELIGQINLNYIYSKVLIVIVSLDKLRVAIDMCMKHWVNGNLQNVLIYGILGSQAGCMNASLTQTQLS